LEVFDDGAVLDDAAVLEEAAVFDDLDENAVLEADLVVPLTLEPVSAAADFNPSFNLFLSLPVIATHTTNDLVCVVLS